jgi:hypothetical protein
MRLRSDHRGIHPSAISQLTMIAAIYTLITVKRTHALVRLVGETMQHDDEVVRKIRAALDNLLRVIMHLTPDR